MTDERRNYIVSQRDEFYMAVRDMLESVELDVLNAICSPSIGCMVAINGDLVNIDISTYYRRPVE